MTVDHVFGEFCEKDRDVLVRDLFVRAHWLYRQAGCESDFCLHSYCGGGRLAFGQRNRLIWDPVIGFLLGQCSPLFKTIFDESFRRRAMAEHMPTALVAILSDAKEQPWCRNEQSDVVTPHGTIMPPGAAVWSAEIRAYGNLIAAAPELFTAALMAMEFVCSLDATFRLPGSHDYPHEADEVAHYLDRALAKAKGTHT